MPTYLDSSGNPISSQASGGKSYLDPSTGEPVTPITPTDRGTIRPMTFREHLLSYEPVGAKGESTLQNLRGVAHNTSTGVAEVLSALANPARTVGGLVSSLNPFSSAPNPIQSTFQALNTRPGEAGPSLIGQTVAAGGLSKLLPTRPIVSPKASSLLTNAIGPEAAEPLAAGGMKEIKSQAPLPSRNLSGVQSAVERAKDVLGTEYSGAIQTLGPSKVMPSPVVSRLQALLTPNLMETAAGRAEAAQIRFAISEYSKPWGFRAMDAERIAARARLDAFHNASDLKQYTKAKSSRSVAIDNAIEQGLKDTLYPAADRALGKPQGYFSALQGRRSSLIRLQDLLKQRITKLTGETEAAKGAPRFSRENMYMTYHPGFTPRIGLHSLMNVIRKPNPLADAASRVAKAFPEEPMIPPEVSRVLAILGGNQSGRQQ